MQQDTNGFKLIQQILKFLAEESTESLSSDGQEKSTGSHQSSSHKINVSDNTSDFSSTESTDCSYSTGSVSLVT